MTRADAQSAVRKLLKIPSQHRRFSCTRADADRVFGIDGDLMDLLMDLGLPYKGGRRDTIFDPVDLENIGLDLHLHSANWASMRVWARSMKNPEQLENSSCEMHISWKCRNPGHEGECRFALSPQLRRVAGSEENHANEEMLVTAHLANDAREFDESFRAVALEAQSLTFHRLPHELAMDMGFLEETRLADCRSASRYLVRFARAAGLPAQPASGYFVAGPFPIPHAWFEIGVGKRWYAADPYWLNTLHRWGIADPDRWPLNSSPRGLLWRLDRILTLTRPLVTDRSRRASVDLMARRTPS
ncbi:transglutaminase domain-containing protein [Streptomyces silvisoli]|uniref:Transglutaminase domain-containing protein n=1 Tax=Streptomyces silvisoli TaxID=3034235 RepID=A0ABT5ZKZ8_9ACTN|nr:transglutaminase domain-containing protein [Streptomyces silvisoli]MDF3290274.1 transglutaminase domain-containing protein [Streptomyces silvisoli]